MSFTFTTSPFDHDATLFRYAPANPQINAGFRSNERYVISTVLHHGSSDVNVDMIVVIVSRQYRVDLANRKRIKNKRVVRRFGCSFSRQPCAASGDPVSLTGYRDFVCQCRTRNQRKRWCHLLISARSRCSLATTSQMCRGDLLLFNFFIQPATPLRESAQDPWIHG